MPKKRKIITISMPDILVVERQKSIFSGAEKVLKNFKEVKKKS